MFNAFFFTNLMNKTKNINYDTECECLHRFRNVARTHRNLPSVVVPNVKLYKFADILWDFMSTANGIQIPKDPHTTCASAKDKHHIDFCINCEYV